MRILSFLMLGLCVSLVQAQPNEAPATVILPPEAPAQAPAPVARPTEPRAQIELDLRAFFRSLNVLGGENPGYPYDVPDHISGARLGFFGLTEWIADFTRQRGSRQYRLDGIEFEQLETDTARVKVNTTLAPPGIERGETVVKTSEVLQLKLDIVPWNNEEKWRIIAPDKEKYQPYQRLSLQSIAYLGRQNPGAWQQLRAEISASNLKRCALGVLQFLQDYDEQFRFENEFWREAILPYTKNEGITQIPGTRNFYTFNDNLSEKNINAIGEAAKTVLFYEGRDEEPIFRYDGRAAICFVDGHIELITRAQEQTLIWKPQAP